MSDVTIETENGSIDVDSDKMETGINALRFAAKCASEDDNARSAIEAHELAEKIESVL